jgi:pyruvate kinase
LGVEIPYVELPDIQKYIINQCRIHGKRVITATEMLESMIHNPRPTRAEISDVANAVYDGTSAVMLSGETAAGAYPVQSVDAMARIVAQAETHTEYIQTIDNFEIKYSNQVGERFLLSQKDVGKIGTLKLKPIYMILFLLKDLQ